MDAESYHYGPLGANFGCKGFLFSRRKVGACESLHKTLIPSVIKSGYPLSKFIHDLLDVADTERIIAVDLTELG